MPVKFTLVENPLTPAANGYFPQVQITDRADLEQVADRMLSLGSSISKADLLAVLTLQDEAVLALLLEGYRVNLAGIVDVYPRLQGVFDGPGDSFDPSRHTLGLSATPSPAFVSRFRDAASVNKEAPTKACPNPVDFHDAGTDTHNGPVTRGNIGTLRGSRLKFDPAKPDEGLFFLAAADGTETKVPTVSTIKPGQLVFLIPATLASGNYSIQVRVRLRDSNQLRSATLDAVLSVV